jgi:anti-anti-sigma regulatory factor
LRTRLSAEELDGATVLKVGGRLDNREVKVLAVALAKLAKNDGAPPVIVDLTGVPIVDPLVPLTIANELCHVSSRRRVAMVTRRLSARQMFRRFAGDSVSIFPSVATALRALDEEGGAR